MTGAATALPARVAAFGLALDERLVTRPLAPVEWGVLTGRTVTERMEGMLAVAVQAGAIAVSDTQRTELSRLARMRASAEVALERETVRASATLHEAGISFRVLKGAAWAHSAYPDPMMRGFGDVDLLIDPIRWYDAVEALERSGATRQLPELRPGFDEQFGKDATLVTASGTEIDLHRTLVIGPYGLWIDCEGLISRPPEWIRLGGSRVPVLDASAAFVHACYNAALTDDPPRLIALRDVAQMAISGNVAAEEVLDLARRWKGVGVIRQAFQLVRSHLGVEVSDTPVGRCLRGELTARDRLLLASYRGPARGYTSQLAGLAAVRGIRPRLAYMGALLGPQSAYLQARGLGRVGYLELVARRLRGSR